MDSDHLERKLFSFMRLYIIMNSVVLLIVAVLVCCVVLSVREGFKTKTESGPGDYSTTSLDKQSYHKKTKKAKKPKPTKKVDSSNSDTSGSEDVGHYPSLEVSKPGRVWASTKGRGNKFGLLRLVGKDSNNAPWNRAR